MQEEDAQKIIQTAGLLLLDAMVFQEVLARSESNVMTLSSMSDPIKISLLEEWDKILVINYEPIFVIASKLLKALPASHNLETGLNKLLRLAINIASSRVLLKHDFFGRVCHQLLLGKLIKYYATFYTSIPAARFLARLVLGKNGFIDTQDHTPIALKQTLRIVDFACGSGTLLSAAYKEMEYLYRTQFNMSDYNELHKYLLGECLWGFDVLWHAVHLAATTLFLHNPDVPISASRTYILPFGSQGTDQIYLGSIDLLTEDFFSPDFTHISTSEIQQKKG